MGGQPVASAAGQGVLLPGVEDVQEAVLLVGGGGGQETRGEESDDLWARMGAYVSIRAHRDCLVPIEHTTVDNHSVNCLHVLHSPPHAHFTYCTLCAHNYQCLPLLLCSH